jgi:hypothetical protein
MGLPTLAIPTAGMVRVVSLDRVRLPRPLHPTHARRCRSKRSTIQAAQRPTARVVVGSRPTGRDH